MRGEGRGGVVGGRKKDGRGGREEEERP